MTRDRIQRQVLLSKTAGKIYHPINTVAFSVRITGPSFLIYSSLLSNISAPELQLVVPLLIIMLLWVAIPTFLPVGIFRVPF